MKKGDQAEEDDDTSRMTTIEAASAVGELGGRSATMLPTRNIRRPPGGDRRRSARRSPITWPPSRSTSAPTRGRPRPPTCTPSGSSSSRCWPDELPFPEGIEEGANWRRSSGGGSPRASRCAGQGVHLPPRPTCRSRPPRGRVPAGPVPPPGPVATGAAGSAPPQPPAPTAGEPFQVAGFLFEDRLTQTFTAVGVESRAVVNLRLVKPGFDAPDVWELLAALAPTPADAPPGVLRRYRVGRARPIPVALGSRVEVDAGATGGGCLGGGGVVRRPPDAHGGDPGRGVRRQRPGRRAGGGPAAGGWPTSTPGAPSTPG